MRDHKNIIIFIFYDYEILKFFFSCLYTNIVIYFVFTN